MAIKKPNLKHKSDGLEEALEEAEKEPVKIFNVKLPLSKHTAFKILTVKKHQKMQDVILKAIDEYLEKGEI